MVGCQPGFRSHQYVSLGRVYQVQHLRLLVLIEWKLTRRSGLFTLLGLRLCLGVGDEAASGGPGLPSMLWMELSSWRLENEFDVTRDVKSNSVAV